MQSARIQMAQRGVMTLPKPLRDQYGLKEGDDLSLIDLGGAFLLTPGRLQVDALAERVNRRLAQKGETMRSMLMALREEREKYGPAGKPVR